MLSVAAYIGIGLGTAAVAELVRRMRPHGRTRRLLRKTKRTQISELTGDVLACIVGIVELDGESITSPVSGRACVAYDNASTEYASGGMYTTTRVQRRMVPFFVVDETGRARVDAAEAALCNRPTITNRTSCVERIVEPGMKIRIVGSVIIDPEFARQAERGYRDGAVRATLTGTAKYPLLVDTV